MSIQGYRVIDSDTHITPLSDLVEGYMTVAEKQRLIPFHKYRIKASLFHTDVDYSDVPPHYEYSFNNRQYLRRLGDSEAQEPKDGVKLPFQSSRHRGYPSPRLEDDSSERIKDMDIEGVDVDFMLQSGRFGIWTSQPDVGIETSWYRGYHNWMDEYCSQFPERLCGVMLASGRDVENALIEIAKWGQRAWAKGIFVYAPEGEPLDHPKLEPIWAAAAANDLAVLLHTFTSDPPFAPGGRDTWDNLWLQRSAAHPWCGMRNMASLVGSGVMDRYPDLRIGVLEAGHGWLPFWTKRLDEHADMVRHALPPLKQKPGEYVTSGRYFQSIEISEGLEMTQMVTDLLGDDILMYASDYPHGESWFPESTTTVLDWKNLGEETFQKLLWGNAARLYCL